MVKRPKLVQMMIDRLAAHADYLDGVPKVHLRPEGDRGDAEMALIRYIEDLERRAGAG